MAEAIVSIQALISNYRPPVLIGEPFRRKTMRRDQAGELTKVQLVKYGLFRCQCGAIFETKLCQVKSGKAKSCGCFARAKSSIVASTHRKSKSRTYSIWKEMHRRCTNPTRNRYECYGGRGISVCERWASFESFLEDMGEPPAGLTLDRIDNDGNYEPSNCRWATRKQQARNTRVTRRITIEGVTKPLADWADMAAVSCGVIRDRLRSGWCPRDAVFGRQA